MRTKRAAGNLVELFSGIQGEGPNVGRRQLFLRLAGCNRHCAYCDQPEARTVPQQALLELSPGMRDFRQVPNPVAADTVARAVRRLHRPVGLHHALAVTGGEPLLQEAFLAALLPRVRAAGLRVLLETNGTKPEVFRTLLPDVDIVSMDLKLPSATGQPMPIRAHRRFLRLAVRHGLDLTVKAVVASATTCSELRRAARIVAAVKRSVPFVLQPVTAVAGQRGPRPPRPEALLALQEAAARELADVRVIPQTHKITGQR